MSKLLHTEQQLLRDWTADCEEMFNGSAIYQVGSTLSTSKKKSHRDVDCRVMLNSDKFKRLSKIVNIDRLNLAVSLWGQKVTGMPIDFQVQDRQYANERHKGKFRSAVSIGGIAKGDGYDQ